MTSNGPGRPLPPVTVDPLASFVGAVVRELGAPADGLPDELAEALRDARAYGDGDVYLTQGRVRGAPVFLVIVQPDGGEPQIAAQVPVDPHGWPQEQLDTWPETGAGAARTWKLAS